MVNGSLLVSLAGPVGFLGLIRRVGIGLRGDMVGFRIDFGGGIVDYIASYYNALGSLNTPALTLRLFPVLSLRASNPPGPMLLLRDFFAGLSPSGSLFLAPIIAPISVVMFSLFTLLAEGTALIDLRDLGLAAGNVMSSREAILAVCRVLQSCQ